MARTIAVPRRFYDDHEARELATPAALRRTRRIVVVSVNDPALGELASDAAHYANADGPDDQPPGLRRSARATVVALGKITG